MSDPLLDAIVAAPDDDAPRLVWADREGGERGELVVVQCALARRDLTREDRRRLIARERDLLFPGYPRPASPRWRPLDGVEGLKPQVASCTFVRGFVESVYTLLSPFAEKMDEVFSRVPLLRRLELDLREGDTDAMLEETLARLRQGSQGSGCVRELSIIRRSQSSSVGGDAEHDDAKIIGSTPFLRGHLRDLELWLADPITEKTLAHLQKLEALTRLNVAANWGGAGWVELFRALPNLRHVTFLAKDGAFHGAELRTFLRAPELAQLRTLELKTDTVFDDDDLTQLATTSSLSNLSRLQLQDLQGRVPREQSGQIQIPKAGVEAIARSPYLARLEELELNCVDNDGLAMLARAAFAPRLRVLGLGFGKVSYPSEATLLKHFPSLECVDIGCTPLGTLRSCRADLEAVIPKVVHY